ncbi:T9SS type A sorting domain-containing protein [Bacteroidota bacterium]
MKLLHNFRFVLSGIVFFLLFLMNSNHVFAQDNFFISNTLPPDGNVKFIYPESPELKVSATETKSDRTQDGDIVFTQIDSLSNAYSYISLSANKTFVYDRTSDNLLTIKRGYYNMHQHPDLDPADYGSNKSSSIFILNSADLGDTWESRCVFEQGNPLNDEGRYPSVYGYTQNDILNAAFAIPLINFIPGGESTWSWYLYGIWNQNITDLELIPYNGSDNSDFEIEGVGYHWSTVSRVLAGTRDDHSEYFLTVGTVWPDDTTDHVNVNNFGLVRSDDIEDEIDISVPEQWKSFRELYRGDRRVSEIIDMKRDNSDKIHLAAFGGFLGLTDETEYSVGVSISSDYGETWGDFDVMPSERIAEYAERHGREYGNANLGIRTIATNVWSWTNKEFAVFDNGDYSIISTMMLFDSDGEYITEFEHHAVECYYEDGDWNIRKIADLQFDFLRYMDNKDKFDNLPDSVRLNPSDYELQVARTLDGSAMVVKWVDIVGVDTVNNVYETTDIFISTKAKEGSSWGEAQNITNSDDIDRVTILPDYIPSDLQDIPILKVKARTAADLTEKNSQFYAGHDQLVLIGHFSTIVDVEDMNYDDSGLEIEIIPNPVSDFARVRVYYEGKTVNAEVALFDMLGRKVAVINNGDLGYGTSYFDYKTTGLTSGVYYCTISLKDRKITKMMNIIK